MFKGLEEVLHEEFEEKWAIFALNLPGYLPELFFFLLSSSFSLDHSLSYMYGGCTKMAWGKVFVWLL
jgi:hypothetical protein